MFGIPRAAWYSTEIAPTMMKQMARPNTAMSATMDVFLVAVGCIVPPCLSLVPP